jgi:hypothetical protein
MVRPATLPAGPCSIHDGIGQSRCRPIMAWLLSHQRLVLDPLRLIRVDPLPAMQVRLVLLVVPLGVQEGGCSSRAGAEESVVLHGLRVSNKTVG